MENLQRHPISAAFGDMSAQEFTELKDRIEVEGVIDPIVVWERHVLDGWQRYNASRQLGMPCPQTQFQGDYEAAIAIVIAKHTRRSMTPAQRALAVVRLYDLQSLSRGRPDKSATAAELISAPELAAKAGVSTRGVHRAKVIERHAIPSVKAAVERGELALGPACKIASLPQNDQSVALLAVTTELRSKKGKVRRAAKPTNPNERPLPTSQSDFTHEQVDALKDRVAELQEAVDILCEENDRLNDRLAALAAGDVMGEEERSSYLERVALLRKELALAEGTVLHYKRTHSAWLTETNVLKDQCRRYKWALKKFGKAGEQVLEKHPPSDYTPSTEPYSPHTSAPSP